MSRVVSLARNPDIARLLDELVADNEAGRLRMLAAVTVRSDRTVRVTVDGTRAIGSSDSPAFAELIGAIECLKHALIAKSS